MKLRKLIPGVVAVLLALVLSVGLMAEMAPNAVAEEQKEEWTMIESGYVRGRDRAVFPCTYYLRFEPNTEAYCSTNFEMMDPVLVDRVHAVIELQNDNMETVSAVPEMQCALEAWIYIPELDRYEKKTAGWGFYGYSNAYGEISCSIQAAWEEDDKIYAGELVSVTARFYLLGQEVGSLSWVPET